MVGQGTLSVPILPSYNRALVFDLNVVVPH